MTDLFVCLFISFYNLCKDIHFDPGYIYPSNPKKYCHRKSHKNKKNTAGKFGALQTDCDSPYSLTNSTFEFLKTNFSQVDFVIYTGDSCRHDRDPKRPLVEEEILFCHQTTVEWFTEYFDSKKVKIVSKLQIIIATIIIEFT